LSKANDPSEIKLNTISVVGFGGLGKTTLVKAVYDKLHRKFDCACFVPVGRNPELKKVLRDILYELDKEKYINIIGSKMDEKQLIDETRKFLADKRCTFNAMYPYICITYIQACVVFLSCMQGFKFWSKNLWKNK
jgi:hypothetical protein